MADDFEEYFAMPGIPVPEGRVISDPVLGELREDSMKLGFGARLDSEGNAVPVTFRLPDRWHGWVRIGDLGDVAISLEPEGRLLVDELVPFAREVVALLQERNVELRWRIVDEFIEDYNKTWNDPDDDDVTRDEFFRSLSSPSIRVLVSNEGEKPAAEIGYSCALYMEQVPLVHVGVGPEILGVELR